MAIEALIAVMIINEEIIIPDNKEIIEDVKGMRTKEYLLKKKMFEYKYQKEIKEI